MLPLKEETDTAWQRTRLQPSIVAAELPRTKGGYGDKRGHSGCRQATPTHSWIMASQL